jgi:hypothetical protein
MVSVKCDDVTITILDIIHHSVLFKSRRFGPGFCLRLQVEPTQLGPIDRASLCLQTTIGFIKPTQHKPPTRVATFLHLKSPYMCQFYLLGYNSVKSGESQSTVRRGMSPPSLGSRNMLLVSYSDNSWSVNMEVKYSFKMSVHFQYNTVLVKIMLTLMDCGFIYSPLNVCPGFKW